MPVSVVDKQVYINNGHFFLRPFTSTAEGKEEKDR